VVIPCVGAILVDAANRVLVVQRQNAPASGWWSIPGGRVEPGETDVDAVRREVREETGLDVTVGSLLGRVNRPGPPDPNGSGEEIWYEIADYHCTVTGGSLRPGDDATDVRWVSPEELRALATSDGLIEVLESWGII